MIFQGAVKVQELLEQKLSFLGTRAITLTLEDLRLALDNYKNGSELESDELEIFVELKNDLLEDILAKYPEMFKVNTSLTFA